MKTKNIRDKFIELYKNKDFNDEGLLEIIGASFIADEDSIFGTPNLDYIAKEISWYNSKSRNVYDMDNPPKIWKDIASKDGNINSNYGWCIYSKENYNQYYEVLIKLQKNIHTRQATMIYTRPTMHNDSTLDGMYDFMCTNAVIYRYSKGKLNAIVQMRSNDAVFGYKNDYAWQKHVLHTLCSALGVTPGVIHWQIASLHIYPRHFNLVC